MAYFQKDENQQQNEQGMNNPQPAAPQAQPEMQAPAAAPQMAQATEPAQSSQQFKPQKQSSSGQTGFQQYQKANQGQAQNRLGQAVQTNLQKNAQQAQGALQRGQNYFQQLMDQGSLQNRGQAVADVTKAAQQARNIYTGNLAQDKQNWQQTATNAQNAATQAAQQKQAEQQRITQGIQNERQNVYNQNLANAQTAYDKANADYLAVGPLNLSDPEAAQRFSNAQAQMYATKNALARAQGTDVNSISNDAIKQFNKDQEQIGLYDFRKTQAEDQAKAAQAQLDRLNAGNWTSGVDADLQKRFADVINARYAGPQSLRDTGAYDQALNRVNKASDLATMAKTAGGREDLLAQLYGRPGSEYTRGMSRLDAALLNSNQDAMKGIQQQGKDLAGTRDALNRANVDTQLAAKNRGSEIAGIRQQARDEFSKQQQAEEALTEGRLDEAIKGGNEFAQYFKDLLQGKTGTTNLNPYEAALLGVSSGEGLYNMGADAVKTQQLMRDQMISKDEFARQDALAKLAGLDLDKTLKATSKYTDAAKAGTQKATDALDVAGTRQALNAAEEQFRKDAQATNLTGYGTGKASKGNMFGKKTRTASSTIQNNVANMLKNAGYDMDSEVGQQAARSILSDADATSRFLTGASTQRQVDADGTLQGAASGAATGASIGSAGGAVGAGIGATIGGYLGGVAGGGTLDGTQMNEEIFRSLGMEPVADAYRAGRDVAATGYDAMADAANFMTAGALKSIPGVSDLSSNISSAIRGIDSSALSRQAKQRADQAARQNLLKNYQNYLTGQGFSNRLGVSTTDKAALDRLSGLQSLLSRLDNTNVGAAPNTQVTTRPLARPLAELKKG